MNNSNEPVDLIPVHSDFRQQKIATVKLNAIMTKHLHQTEIWFMPTAFTTSLQDKSVLIVHPDGKKQPLHIQVKSADPNGPNAGMVALRVWQTWTDKVQSPSVSESSRPPTSQGHVWEAFLEPALIGSLSAEKSRYDFILRLKE